MQLKRIKNNEFDYYYSLLEEDFSYEERKSKNKELKAFENPNFRPCFITDKNNNVLGYFCYWEFEEFIFGEHLAILKDLRNHGYGTEFLNWFLKANKKLVLIEIEHPVSEQAKKRINFYERLGFKLNKYPYTQPSYHKSGVTVDLIITTYPRFITQEEYDGYIELIKKEVYTK